MLAISVDVENELSEIAAEIDHLKAALDRLRTARPAPGSQAAGHVCASATEKIYTGLERIMSRIVADLDHSPIGHGDGWHRSLLQRIANPFPNRREAVISRDCYDSLDRLRSFRHRERNTYGLDLDLDIVLDRSAEAVQAFAVFRTEVRTFFASFAAP